MEDPPDIDDIFLLLGSMLTLAHGNEDVNFEFEIPDTPDTNETSVVDDENQKQNDFQQNTLSVKSVVKDKAIEIYAKKIFENMRKTLKSKEPLEVDFTTKESIKEKDFALVFQLKNVKIYNLASFQVKKFKSISERNAIEFSISIASLKLKGTYDIDGKFLGKTVKGSGDSEVDIAGISLDNGKVTIKETPEEIQITSLSFCYSFKSVSIKQSGLTIEGIKPEEVTKFLNDTLDKYFNQNKQKICEKLASEVKVRANQKLKGKTRDQLQNMMK